MSPKISICLPNLNTRPFLPQRIDSLLAQTEKDWELVIVDNYSDDGAWEYFKERAKEDPRIRISQAPRQGMYANWNNCLKLARGRYIYFATSDDTAEPQALEKLAAPLEEYESVNVAVCDYQTIDENGAPCYHPTTKAAEFLGPWHSTPSLRSRELEFLMHACLGNIWVTMTSVLFRRSLLETTGEFRTDIGSMADVEWTMRAALASDIAWIPEKLATWRIHKAQASAMHWTTRSRRLVSDCLEHVLNDPKSPVPTSWKSVPDWNSKVTHVAKSAYLESFQLYRWNLKNDPGQFLKQLGEAVKTEPAWVINHAVRLFGPGPELTVSSVAIMKELLHTFHAAWPPKRLPAHGENGPVVTG